MQIDAPTNAQLACPVFCRSQKEAPAMDTDDRWLLRKDAAKYLGLSLSTLAHMACEGRGPRYSRPGKHTRYRKSDLDAWAQSQVVEPLPPLLQRYARRIRRSSM